MLHSPTCGHCRENKPRFENVMGQEMRQSNGNFRAVTVNVNNIKYGPNFAKMINDSRWAGDTVPAFLTLNNGRTTLNLGGQSDENFRSMVRLRVR